MIKKYFLIDYHFDEGVEDTEIELCYIRNVYFNGSNSKYIVELEIDWFTHEDINVKLYYKRGIITKVEFSDYRHSYKIKKFDMYNPKTILYLNKQGANINPGKEALLLISIYCNNLKLLECLTRRCRLSNTILVKGFIMSINMKRYEIFEILYQTSKKMYQTEDTRFFIHCSINSVLRNNDIGGLKFLLENDYIKNNIYNNETMFSLMDIQVRYNIHNNETNIITYLLKSEIQKNNIFLLGDLVIIETFLYSFYIKGCSLLTKLSFEIILNRNILKYLFETIFTEKYKYYCGVFIEGDGYSYMKDKYKTLDIIISELLNDKKPLIDVFNYANENNLPELKFIVLKYLI